MTAQPRADAARKLVDEIREAAKQLLGITVKREKAMLRKAKGEKKASK